MSNNKKNKNKNKNNNNNNNNNNNTSNNTLQNTSNPQNSENVHITPEKSKEKSREKDKNINFLCSHSHSFATYIAFILFPFILISIILIVCSIIPGFAADKPRLLYALINILIYIFYLFMLSYILHNGRIVNIINKINNIRKIYYLFAIFYLFIIILSFSKEYICANWNFIIGNFNFHDILKIVWNALNSLKEAIVTVIIFDTAFQMIKKD